MPSVAKVHTEVPPRASHEVERPSRNLKNIWQTWAAIVGVELLRIPEDKYDIVRRRSVR